MIGGQADKEFEIFLSGNRDGLNVLIFTEYINATYFISFDIPLRRLYERGEVNLAVVSQKYVADKGTGCWEEWKNFFQPDVVVLTRYGHQFGVKILEYFRSKNVPVIYHIDDDLLDIPDELGAEIKKRQGAESMIETRRFLLGNCDLIYASTRYLAALFQKKFPGQKIFHGIYAPYMKDFISVDNSREHQELIIGYMGSKGHQHDLATVVPVISRLLGEREDLVFEVFGTIKMPKELELFGSRVRSYSVKKSYVEFLSYLASLKWDVGLAPLANSTFNRCKAPTKFIEYTACNIPVIASNISVYTDVISSEGGVFVDQDWYASISKILDDAKKRQRMVGSADKICFQNFSLAFLEQQLLYLFSIVA